MEIKLPDPDQDSTFSLEKSLASRRSIRKFSSAPLALSQISQLLWAAQGITNSSGYRTAPSAGALYPLEVYLVVGMADKIYPGIYHYHPRQHKLTLVKEGDYRDQLTRAALGQRTILQAPATFVFAAIYERTTGKYGQRGVQYVHMDAGHAAQNFCLQATALGLGTVPVGAFHNDEVAEALQLESNQVPLYILPVGKP